MNSFTVEDIRYRVVDGFPLAGTLYRPHPDMATGTVLIDIHGGAWSENDRLHNACMHRYLAERGIAVFALDFRMAPEHRYPAAVQDVNYGIRWAKANLTRLNGGRNSGGLLGGLGTSSGGHLLALASLLPDDARFFTDDPDLAGHDARLDFVMTCWPILDPIGRYRMAQARGLQNLVDAHHAFWPDEAAMHSGNPTQMLARGETVALPPMLMIQGTSDENVAHEGVDIFAAHYRAAGGVITVHKFEGSPHVFITKEPESPAAIDAMGKIVTYIDERCKERNHA
jgi:acetyl esterase